MSCIRCSTTYAKYKLERCKAESEQRTRFLFEPLAGDGGPGPVLAMCVSRSYRISVTWSRIGTASGISNEATQTVAVRSVWSGNAFGHRPNDLTHSIRAVHGNVNLFQMCVLDALLRTLCGCVKCPFTPDGRFVEPVCQQPRLDVSSQLRQRRGVTSAICATLMAMPCLPSGCRPPLSAK
jgi:hypothetical protein